MATTEVNDQHQHAAAASTKFRSGTMILPHGASLSCVRVATFSSTRMISSMPRLTAIWCVAPADLTAASIFRSLLTLF